MTKIGSAIDEMRAQLGDGEQVKDGVHEYKRRKNILL